MSRFLPTDIGVKFTVIIRYVKEVNITQFHDRQLVMNDIKNLLIAAKANGLNGIVDYFSENEKGSKYLRFYV